MEGAIASYYATPGRTCTRSWLWKIWAACIFSPSSFELGLRDLFWFDGAGCLFLVLWRAVAWFFSGGRFRQGFFPWR